MSFTNAMRPGQPQPGAQPMNGAPQGQGGAGATQAIQKVFELNKQTLAQLARIPGIDQGKVQQATQLMVQAAHLIAEAMPKGQGGGMPQPGGVMPPGARPRPMG
jgi:hypothetical protein